MRKLKLLTFHLLCFAQVLQIAFPITIAFLYLFYTYVIPLHIMILYIISYVGLMFMWIKFNGTDLKQTTLDEW